jgi:cholesterol oxidase
MSPGAGESVSAALVSSQPVSNEEELLGSQRGLHGLYNFWGFRGLDALVSSGLGGGSLIYANVLIRKDEKWFVKEDVLNGGYKYWPVTRSELDPHYDAVEEMLRPQ